MEQSNVKMKYFEELALNLQREGFTTGPEVNGLLPVALDKVTDIAGVTAEYMKQMETAPILKASGLDDEFKLLADFNGTVLAGHKTQ